MCRVALNKPIFILGAHKSGSSLIRSLLDGHPDLFVVPMETHIFQRAGYWVDYRLRRARPANLDIEEIKQNFIAQIEEYNTISTPVSDANLVGKFDIRKLTGQFDQDVSSLSELITIYLRVIYSALFDADLPEELRIVEKSVENAEFASDIKQIYPDAKLLHILRNPYANIVSLRRSAFQRKKSYPFIGRYIRSLYNSYYFLYRNQRLIKDYMVIRYEDLLADARNVMQSVACFLEIEFIESLLQPSSLGENWTGNSSHGVKFDGISAENLDRWKFQIMDLEIHYINGYFDFLLRDYCYDKLFPKSSYLWPVRREVSFDLSHE